MKKFAVLFLAAALVLTCAACGTQASATGTTATTAPATTAPETTAATEATVPETTAVPTAEAAVMEAAVKDDVPYETQSADGLLTITLPNQRWTELESGEHTVLFSDGDCAITVDMLKATDPLPSMPMSDETHALIFNSSVSAKDYLMLITGYAHEETDFAPIAKAIGTIVIDRTKVPDTAVEQPAAEYTVRDANYSAWVTATRLNVRAASGTEANIIASLNQNTKVTVTGEVMENGKYIGWSRITMSNGTTGFVAAQFLTTTQPQAKATRTGTTKNLWSDRGTLYVVYQYTDNTWKTDDGTTYWPDGFSTWTNAAQWTLYDYNPVPATPAAPSASRTGTVHTLWDASGNPISIYEYTDYTWKSDSGVSFWPDGFSTWQNSQGNVYYDYDPSQEVTEPTTAPTAPADWQQTFESALWAHDGMIACWYTYLSGGMYEVTVQKPDDPNSTGTVYVDSYTGSWNWA